MILAMYLLIYYNSVIGVWYPIKQFASEPECRYYKYRYYNTDFHNCYEIWWEK